MYDYEVGEIEPGPGVADVQGPRPPKLATWWARVEYNENNEIKRIINIEGAY